MAGKDVNEVGRLDEKKKKKREDLLNATYELFTSKGVFDTSISDIVKKANMAKGTFYLYFKDKYDIRNALITKKAGELFSVAYEKMYRKKFSSLEATVICSRGCYHRPAEMKIRHYWNLLPKTSNGDFSIKYFWKGKMMCQRVSLTGIAN